jgi:hypothetical protein
LNDYSLTSRHNFFWNFNRLYILEVHGQDQLKTHGIIIVLILIAATSAESQIGLGADAGLLHPGLSKSGISGSQFDTGWGYEFLIRHNLVQIGDSLQLKARWSYRHAKTTIKLPNVLEIWFKFNYLTLNLFIDVLQTKHFSLYSGLGGSLVSVNAEKDFLKVDETAFLPEVILGGEFMLGPYYNLFTECSFQSGSVKTEYEILPMTGFRIVVGATMFLITE